MTGNSPSTAVATEGSPIDWQARFAALPAADDISLTNLKASLQTLDECGVSAFRPARLRYIRALLKRAESLREQRADGPLTGAAQALGDILRQLQQALPAALARAAQLKEARPALTEQVDQLLARADFDALERLARRAEPVKAGQLAALVAQLEQTPLPVEQDTTSTLVDTLRSQERELVAAHAAHAEPSASAAAGSRPLRAELRSVRGYRDSLRKAGAGRLVARSIAEAPPESGPLNPQMLATQTLARMQQLSPACSVYYVNYLQILLSLDSLPEAGERK